MPITFRDISFGFADAEKERTRHPDLLLSGFDDSHHAIPKLLGGDEWLVLGNKGSGKSAIAQHLELRSGSDSKLFVTTRFLSELPYARMCRLLDVDGEGCTAEVWQLLVLLHVFDSLALDAGARRTEDFWALMRSLRHSGLLPTLDLKAFAAKATKQTFKITTPIGELGSEQTEPERPLAQCIFLIEALKGAILSTETTSRHLLIIDGLDDQLAFVKEHEHLSSLVVEVDRLNSQFATAASFLKVILLCRTDLYERLPGTNTNKPRQDSAIELQWVHRADDYAHSPLVNLVNNKARVSDRAIIDLFEEYLPIPRSNRPSASYLQDFTRGIPRDLLTALRFIQQATSGHSPTQAEVVIGLRQYAERHFLPEIRNEVQGFVEQERLDLLLEVFLSMDRQVIAVQDIRELVLSEQRYRELDLDRLLAILYEVGAVGAYFQRSSRQAYYSFKFRDHQSGVASSGAIVLHPALRLAVSRTYSGRNSRRKTVDQEGGPSALRAGTSERARRRRRRRSSSREQTLDTIVVDSESALDQMLLEITEDVRRSQGGARWTPYIADSLSDLFEVKEQRIPDLHIIDSSRKKGIIRYRLKVAKSMSVRSKGTKTLDSNMIYRVAEAADEYRKLGLPVALEPMASEERAAIHQFARLTLGVPTHSDGTADERHVVIGRRPAANDDHI